MTDQQLFTALERITTAGITLIAVLAVAGFIIHRRQQAVIDVLAHLAELVDTENKPRPDAHTPGRGTPSDSKGVKPNASQQRNNRANRSGGTGRTARQRR